MMLLEICFLESPEIRLAAATEVAFAYQCL